VRWLTTMAMAMAMAMASSVARAGSWRGASTRRSGRRTTTTTTCGASSVAGAQSRSAASASASADVDEDGLRLALGAVGLVLRERVDQGSFAVVYKATSTGLNGFGGTSWQGEVGTEHAVKILSATASTVSSRRDFKREATLLTKVKHPNIVKVQYYDETPQPFMVTEFCSSGNLWNALRAEEIKASRLVADAADVAPIPDDMPLLDLPALMKDIAEALAYLHAAGFAHRDIKSSNILLTWSEERRRIQAMLCDFGSAAPVNKMPRRPKRGALEKVLGLGKGWQPVGTMLWMAPEMLRPPIEGEELAGFGGDKADIYALGIVLWECLNWRVPWVSEGAPTRERVIDEVVNKRARLPAGKDASRTVASLLSSMFKTSPAERPSAAEVTIALSAMKRRWDKNGAFEVMCQSASAQGREVAKLLESTSVDRETQNVIEEEARAAAAATTDMESVQASADEADAPTAANEVTASNDKPETLVSQDLDPEAWLGEVGTVDADLLCENLLNMVFPHILEAEFNPEMTATMASNIEELEQLTNKYNELKRRSRTDPFAALATDAKGREVKRMANKIERVEVEAQVKAWDRTRNMLREQLKKAEEEHSEWKRTLRRL
jgi:serine/threonine protein kinase